MWCTDIHTIFPEDELSEMNFGLLDLCKRHSFDEIGVSVSSATGVYPSLINDTRIVFDPAVYGWLSRVMSLDMFGKA